MPFDAGRTLEDGGVSPSWNHTVKGPAVIYLSPSLSPTVFFFHLSFPAASDVKLIKAWSTRRQVPANGINMVDG